MVTVRGTSVPGNFPCFPILLLCYRSETLGQNGKHPHPAPVLEIGSIPSYRKSLSWHGVSSRISPTLAFSASVNRTAPLSFLRYEGSDIPRLSAMNCCLYPSLVLAPLISSGFNSVHRRPFSCVGCCRIFIIRYQSVNVNNFFIICGKMCCSCYPYGV